MAGLQLINKNKPSDEWISSLKQRFRCEKEVDWVLTNKLKRRAGPGFTPISLDVLSNSVVKQLTDELDDSFEVNNPRWLSGGASKMQMAFDLDWNDPQAGRSVTPMVVRMEPAESIMETSRLRESQLIEAFADVVPVPRTYWVDREAKYFPYPALIYGFAEGVTKPSKGSGSGVSGTGINFGLGLRDALAPQFVRDLANIHKFDWRQSDLSAFDVPQENSTQAVEWNLNWWERVWEEDSNEEVPLMRYAAQWLRVNMPSIDVLSIVHGDYRSGNFLFDEDSAQISAWLDWESGHIGDRHEDLAYVSCATWGSWAEDNATFLVCGMMPEDDFYEAYEKASGMSVDKKIIDYYKVFNGYKLNCVSLATAYRAIRGGKTHQDIVLGVVMGASYLFLDELRSTLEEVA